jgi:predicted MFS family arabinose efflux permease
MILTRSRKYLYASFSGIPTKIWLLALVSLVNRMGSMVVSFLSLYLTTQLHFTLAASGWAMACFGLGSIAGNYLGGWLTDRFHYFHVQWLSLASSGVALLGLMLVRDFWAFCGMMFLFTLLAESFRPANSVAIRENSNAELRIRAFSLMRVGVNLAISLALIVGGLLVALGWAWLFWVDALTSFAAAIVLLVYMRPKKRTVAERQTAQIKIPLTQSAYRDRQMLFFTFLTFIGATVFMQIVWTVPIFLQQIYHWNTAQIGATNAVNGITVMLVELPLVFQIENKRPKLWFVQLGILLYLSAYALLLLPTAWAVVAAVAYMFVISFGEIFVMPFSTAWVTLRAGNERQGQYMGLYGMAYSAAHVFAPVVGTQVISAFGFSAFWTMLIAFCIVAFSGFWYLSQRTAAK